MLYDPNSAIGQVRTLIGDTDEATFMLQDSEITALLSIGYTTLKAAALALRRIAATKAFTAKSIRAGNYAEDTRGAVQYIIDLAKSYEEMDSSIPAESAVEVIFNDFNYRTILRNKVLRLESIYEGGV
jgi:uncharacterized membrane protein